MNKKLKKKLKQKLLNRVDKKVLGYHVYRSTDPNLPFAFWARLTDEPIPESSFHDSAAEIGTRFYYKLTQVFADGSESSPVNADTQFTDHAGKTYEQNPLIDFVGYNIYRSIDANIPLEQWEKRNDKPLPDNNFKDEGVKSGEIYFYYVRAVDSKGTESSPSEITRVIRK
jgi:fibronectin type 3 domain-containing protein